MTISKNSCCCCIDLAANGTHQSWRFQVNRTVKEQVNSGLRLGAGLGVFLVACVLLGHARNQMQLLSGQNQSGYVYWVVLLEVIIATGLLFWTAHVWYQLLAGCLLFGVLTGLLSLITGKDLLPYPQPPTTLLKSLTIIVYCVLSLVLMFRFDQTKLKPLDRIALTSFFLCVLPSGFVFASSWPIVGLIILFVSWVVFRLQKRRDSTQKVLPHIDD